MKDDPEDVERLKVIKEWIHKAEEDLKAATYLLKLKEDCPLDTVSFHAQQTVEKYLKALLVLINVHFPKTHDIGAIIALLPGRFSIRLSPEEKRRFTDYATITRYPGDYEPVTRELAERALSSARRVRKTVRKYLPKVILRKSVL